MDEDIEAKIERLLKSCAAGRVIRWDVGHETYMVLRRGAGASKAMWPCRWHCLKESGGRNVRLQADDGESLLAPLSWLFKYGHPEFTRGGSDEDKS